MPICCGCCLQLRNRAWNPTSASTILEFDGKLREWGTEYRYLREADGAPIPNDQRRELLIRILPPDLSVAFMNEIHKHGD